MKNKRKKHDDSLPARQTRKEMISYYDMGALPAAKYEPVDEFLGITKRFGPSAIFKENMFKLMIGVLFWLVSICMFVSVLGTNDMKFGIKLVALMMWALVFLYTGFSIGYIIKKWNTPHLDELCMENILAHDGIDAVNNDMLTAESFGDGNLIGRRYIFLKNQTVIRIADITKTDVIIVKSENEGGYYAFAMFVSDELGSRKYAAAELHIHSNKSDEFRALDSMIKERQGKLLPLDIEGLPGD